MKKHGTKPPSRIKYNEEHPIVSIRVTKELKKLLDDIQEKTGKSLGDILREAVGVQSPSTKDAYISGYRDAHRKYAVVFKCYGCGGNATIDSEEVKQAAARLMREDGWGHTACAQRT